MSLKRVFIGLAALIGVAFVWLAFAATGFPAALKPKPAPEAVLIDDVRLISMAPGAAQAEEARAVLIVGDRIEAIGAAGSLAAPAGAAVIDGAGKTLLPGLVDAHVHVWDEAELAGYLAHGVTAIRNMSGMPFHLPLQARIAERKILGPDFITTGPILNSPGPNQQDNHQLVATAEEARAAVQKQYDAGYRHLKIYSNLQREAYEAVLSQAAALGMSVSGHTPEGVREHGMPEEKPFDIAFEDSLGRGLTTIEHVESIMWHGARDRLDDDAMRAIAEKIAASGDTVDATLIAHDNLVRVARSKGAYLTRPGTETINPAFKMLDKGTYERWSHADPDAREAPRAAFYLKSTKILHDAGVRVIAGTDAGIFTNIPGSAMTRELELFVKAGLTPHEALAAATREGAAALGFEKTGIVAPGWRANLILVSGDPLANISMIENPDAVLIGGYLLDDEGLAAMRKAATQTSFVRSMRRILALLFWL